MTLTDRIHALTQLGDFIQTEDATLEAVMARAFAENGWFTIENQRQALREIATEFLNADKLRAWMKNYSIPEAPSEKVVALILAGNIPLVGFHDVLCVFVCGFKARIKLSDKDAMLLPFLLLKLIEIDPRSKNFFDTTEGPIKNMDAIIATGSNNSSRYFEAYFSKYPHIIRRNRTAVALLNGKETTDDLGHLRSDITNYYGLGCRNVSHLFVPENYDFTPLLDVLHEEKSLINLNKFKNNLDYNSAIMLLNDVKHLVTAATLVTENASLTSPIAVLHYSFYKNLEDVTTSLQNQKEQIQLVVSNEPLDFTPLFKFGAAQSPQLNDYADGVDTLLFLSTI